MGGPRRGDKSLCGAGVVVGLGLGGGEECPRYRNGSFGFWEVRRVRISMEQAVRAGLLPLHHRDPFDRLLVAQAQALNAPILSADAVLDQYDVKRVC